MANIFEDAWNAGKEWAGDVKSDAEKYVTKKVVDYKINEFKENLAEKYSFKDAFVSHDKMTPELEAAGWKPGLDGVPYNPAIAYTAEDWANDQKNANSNRSGRASGAVQQSAPAAKLSQDLRQRTPSGTMYNPDLSEYNDSSLFDYKGPGGVSEYTYGQGLPTEGAGYDIWGTPTDVANPYYEGQFGEGYTTPEPGVADSAITLAPITMPAGVPQIPTSNTNTRATTTPTGGTSPYQSGMNSNLLNSFINEAQGGGLPGYTNNGTTSAADQSIFDAAKAQRFGLESGTVGNGYTNNGVTSAADQALFDAAKVQRFGLESGTVGNGYTNNGVTSAADQSIFNNAMQDRLLQQEKETVSNGYVNNGITTPEDQSKFDAAKLSRFNPSGGPNIYASQYSPTTDTGLISIPEEEQQQLMFSQPMSVDEQARRTNPSIFDNAIMMEIGDIINKDSPIKQQYGLDEATRDALGYINSGDVKAANANFNQMKINQPTTSGYAGNIMINPMTADTSPSEIAFQNAFTTQLANNTGARGGRGNVGARQLADSFEYQGSYEAKPKSNAVLDAVIANSINQSRTVNKNKAATTSTSKPRPTAPAGGYSTKQYNNNFATRRNVRNLFA